ncbi:hypothetical protein RU820_05010 [Acidithiobacillus ferrooxidans]|uniref:hypothetical protein n=1 Tax=Acidithiobacillus TaxID=119977 RepID=UPI00059FEA26|nr:MULTISPECIES: hypothetical protein [Acidithiobacillus]MBN6744218.1 hypothetical protein [Acidithiobacillus sp. MC2.2]MBN6746928.1 hypothetical protein [Acidithiobacillus sp. PG05]
MELLLAIIIFSPLTLLYVVLVFGALGAQLYGDALLMGGIFICNETVFAAAIVYLHVLSMPGYALVSGGVVGALLFFAGLAKTGMAPKAR